MTDEDRESTQIGGRRLDGDSGHLREAPTEEVAVDAALPPDGFLAPRACPGQVVDGRYRVVELIGRGGFSQVFRATEVETSHSVALKFLDGHVHGSNVEARMRRELRLARDLRHPNIVRVFDLVESDGRQCLAMELVEGRTVKDVVSSDGALPVTRAVAVLTGIASALAAVHAAGVVHRDLKPQNVMLTASGEVKLLDFGLAKTPDSTGLTATGTILGTPDCMSPEQVDGKPADERSDVYSLGVIAYEVLVGKPPFRGDTPLAIALQHVRSRVPDPSRSRPQLAAELCRLIVAMTEPSPARRPGSAQVVLLELERLQAGKLEREGAGRSTILRRLAMAAAASAVTVAVVLGTVATTRQRRGPPVAGDPFADGVVHVAVRHGAQESISGGRRFIAAVASAAREGIASPRVEVVHVDDEDAPNGGGAVFDSEQVLDLSLRAVLGEQGRLYRVGCRVVDSRTADVWLEMEPVEVVSLDFEAVDLVSAELVASYLAAVAERMGEGEGEG